MAASSNSEGGISTRRSPGRRTAYRMAAAGVSVLALVATAALSSPAGGTAAPDGATPGADAAVNAPANAPAAGPTSSVVYNSTRYLTPGGVSFNSEGFECCEISQLGNAVGLTTAGRTLTSVTITMDDWAVYTNPAGTPPPGTPVSPWKGQPTGNPTGPNGATYSNPAGFYLPVTLNLYNAVPNATSRWTAGSLITSVNQTVLIPWQPTPSWTFKPCLNIDTNDFGGNLQAWDSIYGCRFGFAADISISLGAGVVVPKNVVWGLAYNTQTYGNPGTGISGPYNSLNVALTPSVNVGTDINPGSVFLTGGNYPYGTSGVAGVNDPNGNLGVYNTFRNDCLPGADGSLTSDNGTGCAYWQGYVPAIEFLAAPR